MCARRFLIAIFILTLLAVASAFAIFQFGQKVLISQATPRGSFEAPPPNGPNYALTSSWVARPDLPANPSFWTPEGYAEPLEGVPTGKAAVFFIHPTTYLEREHWNAPLLPGGDTESRTNLFVRSQSSAFNHVGDIWAPRYRQAAFGAFLLTSDDAQKALDLAYADVEAAFTRFLAEVPAGRPLILAGHSQGALHLSRLLAERGPQLKNRLVAAYVVGWPLSTTADLPAMGLPACAAPQQRACILSWQSFGDPPNPDLILDTWEKTKGPSGIERRRKDMLCVNPLTGTAGAAAPPASNPGTLLPTGDLTSATIEPGRVGARCEDGFLIVEGDLPPLGPFVLPGNNYHVYDYALFWGAIRRDAGRRMSGNAAR